MSRVTCSSAGAQVVPSACLGQQNANGQKMTFWQENYTFIKDVYDMRHTKMAEWMENVEKAIARIMADKVYTSAEFKRERDNFHALCKDLERAEVKKWLAQILEILMAERAKDQKAKEGALLDGLIKKHEELIPTVSKTQVMVDLYWKCYAYGDELKPHIEFLDGIMLSSTRDIAPSCVENVDELIERQEKSLVQLETKRGVVKELIEKGKKILENPDKPKFLEGNVKKIQEGWEETKEKAAGRLKLLQDTKEAWIGYAENSETIASDFEYCEEEESKVKKEQIEHSVEQRTIYEEDDCLHCGLCTFSSKSKKNMLRHSNIVHGVVINDKDYQGGTTITVRQTAYHCTLCKFKGTTREELAAHRKRTIHNKYGGVTAVDPIAEAEERKARIRK